MNIFNDDLNENFEVSKISTRFNGYAETITLSPKNIVCEKQGAFTLAETLITLAILGVVAALAIPQLVRSQVDKANKVKIQKAMAVYEKFISQMVVENDIHSDAELAAFMCDTNNGDGTLTNEAKKYLKITETGTMDKTNTGEYFKTPDGVYWTTCWRDHYDLYNNNINRNTIVTFSKDAIMNPYLSGMVNGDEITDQQVPYFQFTWRFLNGALHINDDVSFKYAANKNHLYNYINGTQKVDYKKDRCPSGTQWNESSYYCE